MFSLELIRIQALHVSSMVLVEVREFVVEQNCRVQVNRDVGLDEALPILTVAELSLERSIKANYEVENGASVEPALGCN